MRTKVRLDTLSDVKGFVRATSSVSEPVVLTDGNNLTVNAKSVLGVIYTMEWSDVYCTCDRDIYGLIEPYIAED